MAPYLNSVTIYILLTISQGRLGSGEKSEQIPWEGSFGADKTQP